VAHNSWLISTKLDQEAEFVKTWPFQKTPNVALSRDAQDVTSAPSRLRAGPRRTEDSLPAPERHHQARAVSRP
jgi:hypothetical protein